MLISDWSSDVCSFDLLRRPASRPHAEKGRRVTARRGEIVMRIYAATLGTETNTFSPIPTSRASFEETLYAPPGRHPDQITLFTAPLWIARRRAKEDGDTLVEGLRSEEHRLNSSH